MSDSLQHCLSGAAAAPEPTANCRGAKRPRTVRVVSTSTSDQENEDNTVTGIPRYHTRVVIACKACRARKTKCDSGRPTCTFCTKRNVVCEYDEARVQQSECQLLGPQILDAIINLTELVRQQQVQQSSHHRRDISVPTSVPHGSYGISLQSPVAVTNNIAAESSGYGISSCPQAAFFTQGLDSILQWNVFPQGLRIIPVYDDGISQMPHVLPLIDYAELIRLEARYIAIVHTKNPMLDLVKLRQYISKIAENGLDWSTSTCLVALVCAVGSLCREYVSEASGLNEDSEREKDIDIALRFWGVASKRLGLAMSENTLEAVQCVCLTGIWYMCNFQPLQAWKYFTMAGNSWYFATVARNPSSRLEDDTRPSESIEQSTFFTSYKSELEIRHELAMHGSILDNLDYPHTFPLPPIFDTHRSGPVAPDKERVGWYYYLSEIAARHLINRLVKAQSIMNVQPSARELQRMLADLEIYETQLHEWYISLPPRISFEIPNESIKPCQDEFQQILRSRYMFIRELCYRPFVRVCLNNNLDMPDDLIRDVASVASQGLQNCAWRLQCMSSCRTHSHGLWFMIRIAVSSSMMLIGAVRAQHNTMLNAAPYLQIPADWRQQILRVLDILGPFEYEKRGGVMECIQMLRWALGNFVK